MKKLFAILLMLVSISVFAQSNLFVKSLTVEDGDSVAVVFNGNYPNITVSIFSTTGTFSILSAIDKASDIYTACVGKTLYAVSANTIIYELLDNFPTAGNYLSFEIQDHSVIALKFISIGDRTEFYIRATR